MSGRVVSADTNSSRRREFVFPIQHGRESPKLEVLLKIMSEIVIFDDTESKGIIIRRNAHVGHCLK